jgi:Protein of unknwon function (DUF3008)
LNGRQAAAPPRLPSSIFMATQPRMAVAACLDDDRHARGSPPSGIGMAGAQPGSARLPVGGTGTIDPMASKEDSMPSKSKAQQKAAGAALAAKRGETKVSELKGASKSMYESMSKKQLKDFASTPRKGKREHNAKSKSGSRSRS